MAGFTEEEVRVLVEMGDIDQAEAEQLRLQAQSDATKLRLWPGRRMDMGSQIGRGLSGIASAKFGYDAREKGDEISGKKRDVMRALEDAMLKQKMAGIQQPGSAQVNSQRSPPGGAAMNNWAGAHDARSDRAAAMWNQGPRVPAMQPQYRGASQPGAGGAQATGPAPPGAMSPMLRALPRRPTDNMEELEDEGYY